MAKILGFSDNGVYGSSMLEAQKNMCTVVIGLSAKCRLLVLTQDDLFLCDFDYAIRK
jgi:hypothetical protein